MKNLRKIFLTLLLFLVIPSGTTALVKKNECQKKEVTAKKKKSNKIFFFAVYCIACYATCPFVVDHLKNRFIKNKLDEFDEEFDKFYNEEINKQKQDNVLAWGFHVVMEDQVKKGLEWRKKEIRDKLKKKLLLQFDNGIKEFREEMGRGFFLAPLLLPIIIVAYYCHLYDNISSSLLDGQKTSFTI